MRIQRFAPKLSGWVSVGLLCATMAMGAQAAEMKIETLLVWGTNDRNSPDPTHKPVSPELKKKLQELPLKWTNYFEVNRVTVELPASGVTNVALSDKCHLELRNLGHSNISVTHFGKGKRVGTRTQPLAKNETLILGGNAPDATSWLGVIRRVE